MIHPSYLELMEVLNKDLEEGDPNRVESRYSIVKATSIRAKQIIDSRYLQEKYDKLVMADKENKNSEIRMTPEEEKKVALGQELIEGVDDLKPLSVAVQEFAADKVKIINSNEAEPEA